MSWQPGPSDWPTLKRERGDWDDHVRDVLPAYVNGTLDPGEIGRVSSHLERCSGCRAALGSWEAIAGAVRSSAATRDRAADRPLDRVMAAIGESVPSRSVAARASPQAPTGPRILERAARVRRRPLMAELSSAAVLVMIVVGVVAAFRLAPEDGRRPVPGAATEATPPAGASVTVLGPDEAIDIAECTTRPRPAGTVAGLIGSRAGTVPILPRYNSDPVYVDWVGQPVNPDDVLGGRPEASRSVLDGIRTAVRALTACRFDLYRYDGHDPDQYDGRYWALFSDDYFRREFSGYAEAGVRPALTAFFIPGTSQPMTIEAARQLPDGRVAVVVAQPAYAMYGRRILVFVKAGESWLVDEVADVEHRPRINDQGTPEPVNAPQLMTIVLRDDATAASIVVANYAYRADSDLTITIANLGEGTQRVEIAALELRLDVPGGHSTDVVVNVPVGSYRVTASTTDASGNEMRTLDADLPFVVDPGTPTPRR